MALLYRSISILIYLIEILILVRIIISFFNMGNRSPLFTIVYELTEPVLGPSRELIHKLGINTGMFDFSPLVAIFLLRIIDIIAKALLL
ncbi:MAG: YggT family protein [Tissierellia bacterium]|nr:YggT family protein [Tissierellia bacterium]